jgi:hypothetical protein
MRACSDSSTVTTCGNDVRPRDRSASCASRKLFYQHDTLVPSPWSFAECPRCSASWVRVVSVKPSPVAVEDSSEPCRLDSNR